MCMTDAPLAYWLRGGTGPDVVLPCINWLFGLLWLSWRWGICCLRNVGFEIYSLIVAYWLEKLLLLFPLQVLNLEHYHWSVPIVGCVRWVLFVWLISVCYLEWLIIVILMTVPVQVLNLEHCHWSMTLVECVRWVLFVWLISVCHLEWLIIVILMTVPLRVLNLEHYHWGMTLVECVRWVLFVWLISVCHLEWLVSNSDEYSFTGAEFGALSLEYDTSWMCQVSIVCMVD